ncbi:MAG TPA: Fis family transcriptional regulator, partial [Solibacterales bacterium]|nr:Fis family transcriptional regulator [Bryobacterales bacterium]
MQSATAIKVRGRILIVDDDPVVRDSLGKWFDSEGYDVTLVASGKEALERLAVRRWDVALLDIKMPGMDGIELHERVHDADPDLPVIMMTGY